MKLFVVLALAAVAAARPQEFEPVVQVVSQDGASFSLDNGVSVNEGSTIREDGQAVRTGSYTFTAPNGETFTVTFEADEFGFRASGDHLPVAPPMPAHALAQIEFAAEQRRLEAERLALE